MDDAQEDPSLAVAEPLAAEQEVSDGMAEARDKATAAMRVASAELIMGAVSVAASTTSAAATFSPTTTKKS